LKIESLLIALVAFSVNLPAPVFGAEVFTGRVVAVLDGDTLDVLQAGNVVRRVRMAEIDAPEKAQAFGSRSKLSLSGICFSKQAQVQVIDTDRYGRTVGRVNCDGTDANLIQVQRGMAWAYRQYAKDPIIIHAENQAREQRIGLWADPSPTPPWQWRRLR